MCHTDTSIIGRRFTYLSKIGTWPQGTILGIHESGNYIAHLDCQKNDETWLIHPAAIGKHYFLI